MTAELKQFNRTRMAPTPSGYLHLGNVLSFVITAGLAADYHARTLLRIDDLDRQRANLLYEQDIFDTLHFLELPWQEGPKDIREFRDLFSQVHQLERYQQAWQQLADRGLLFACTCSRSDLLQHNGDHVYKGSCLHKGLPLDTPGSCLRLRTDHSSRIKVKTLSGTTAALLPPSMHYAVLRKKDGMPAYQLASVSDDLYYGVDLVVRGEDLWPSTLLQLQLAQLSGATELLNTTFHHHQLLPAPSGLKLSKSAGDTSVQYLRRKGHTAADLYTMIAAQLGMAVPVANWKELFALLAPER